VLGIIGAGGLGYQLLLSTRSLKFAEMWTLIYALAILGGAVELWSGTIRRRLAFGRPGMTAGGFVNAREGPISRWPQRDRLLTGSLALALALTPWSWWRLNLDPRSLFEPQTLSRLATVLTQSWPPRLPAGGALELARLSAQTVSMSVLAMVFAGALAFLLSFPAASGRRRPDRARDRAGTRRGARGWPQRWLRILAGGLTRTIVRSVLLLLRAVPPPIWALMAIWTLYPGILPGALALAAYTTGILGRLMAEVVENSDPRPLQALEALGAGGPGKFAYGLLPASLPRYASYLLYRWEVCIRATVVVGLVGAGGLGQLFRHQIASFDYPGLTATLACFVGLTLLVDGASSRLRPLLR